MMEAIFQNGSLIILTLGVFLVLLNLGQLWYGRRHVNALKEHDWELRQVRPSMQQLEVGREGLTNNLVVIAGQLAESSDKLQQFQVQSGDTISPLTQWNTTAKAVAAELQTLVKSDVVAEFTTPDNEIEGAPFPGLPTRRKRGSRSVRL